MTLPETAQTARPDVLIGIKITPEGVVSRVDLRRVPEAGILHDLYEAIGSAWVDVLGLTDHIAMWIADDPTAGHNATATGIVHHFQRSTIDRWPTDYSGTAVFLGFDREPGQPQSLTGAPELAPDQLAQLQTVLTPLRDLLRLSTPDGSPVEFTPAHVQHWSGHNNTGERVGPGDRVISRVRAPGESDTFTVYQRDDTSGRDWTILARGLTADQVRHWQAPRRAVPSAVVSPELEHWLNTVADRF